MRASTRKWTVSLLVAAALLPSTVSAQIPPPSPPACVSGCENQGDPPAREPRCTEVPVQYACGTEEKCDDLPGRGVVCVEVERICNTTETICE